VQDAIAAANIPIVSGTQAMIPKNTVPVDNKHLGALLRMVDALEEHDDVQNVFGNYEIDDSQMESLA